MPGRDRICFVAPPPRWRYSKRLVRAQPRHPRADCRSLGERGGMMSDDVILRRSPYLIIVLKNAAMARTVPKISGDIPLPRSLTRSARSFGCGERYRLTGGAEISWHLPGRSLTGKQGHGEAIFHRLRPLTSITKSDAQISGGETRQDKDTRRFPWWLPRALSCSCLSVYRCHSAVMAAFISFHA